MLPSLILTSRGMPKCLTFQCFCYFENQDSLVGYGSHVVPLAAVFVRPKCFMPELNGIYVTSTKKKKFFDANLARGNIRPV